MNWLPLAAATLLALLPAAAAAQVSPVCRNKPTFTCNRWANPEACWCGEWTDGIWAQRHWVHAHQCQPGFALQGYSDERWGQWAREEVGSFLRYMEDLFGDDNRACTNPRRPVDWREVEAVYWQSQCFSGYSGTGLAVIGKCAAKSQGGGPTSASSKKGAKAAQAAGAPPSSGGEPTPDASR